MLEYDATFFATGAAAHCFVHTASHVRPVLISSHGAIHTTLCRVAGEKHIM